MAKSAKERLASTEVIRHKQLQEELKARFYEREAQRPPEEKEKKKTRRRRDAR